MPYLTTEQKAEVALEFLKLAADLNLKVEILEPPSFKNES